MCLKKANESMYACNIISNIEIKMLIGIFGYATQKKSFLENFRIRKNICSDSLDNKLSSYRKILQK